MDLMESPCILCIIVSLFWYTGQVLLSVGIVTTGVLSVSGRFRQMEQVFVCVHCNCCATCVLWTQRVIFNLLETVDF